ncbi:MAG: 2,3-bisphosphoglycerate-independent phosphoglycerate mutase [Clostridia bacterium]|nr:2,3-bisphosphoglycerate-independent phosphoglycerate mutase [Clostridia bacterium]
MNSKNVLLVIMDGYGIAPKSEFNAVSEADTPNLDKIFSENPTTTLSASGISVGLPDGQMGNSEVGHTNIGAGRVVYQDLTYINKSIESGEFYSNKVLNAVMDKVRIDGSTLHIMGLCSGGGVHSHVNHLLALLELAKQKDLKKLAVHAWTDGRDTAPKVAERYLQEIENHLRKYGFKGIQTICGRFYAMDRDRNLERTQVAVDGICQGKGAKFTNISEVVKSCYDEGVTDEFFPMFVREGYGGFGENDAVICFNYRPDRARQITRSISEKVRDYVCFTEYDKNFKDVKIAFPPRQVEMTLGEYLSSLGMKQLRIAETEKYAHVTFFFNAGVEKPYEGEDRIIINSPKVKTYDLKPEMSAFEITKIAKEKIKSKKYNLIVLNFANPDMVGHTGNFEATKKAVETVDECVSELLKATHETGGVMIVTADHGNAEKMLDESGNPHTAHTCSPVPFSVVGYECRLKNSGALCDIAPTICKILDIKKPDEMSGVSLI